MTEFQKLQDDLQGLSDQQREAWSLLFRSELTSARDTEDALDSLTPRQKRHLKRLIQEGADSGDPVPLDMDAVIRRNEARWKAEHPAS